MKTTYVDHMGTDARVVDAARVSFSKLSEDYTEEQNDKLLGYLAKHGHFTPFTHPQITIHEKVPIFVARQRFKHMVGFTYNEVSRRYVADTPEFFTPKEWRGKSINAKQGSSDETVDEVIIPWGNGTDLWGYQEVLDLCVEYYESMIKVGVAPEQARMVLPQSMYTEYFCTGSLSAWSRAYKLRIDNHSQKEIQLLAEQWDEIIRPLFPKAWSCLVD